MVSRQLNGSQLCVSFPNFCLGRPFRFSAYRDSICLVSNFCLDRPFGFSIHRDAHFFLPKLPFQVFNLASCFFLFQEKYFLTMSAFTGCGKSSPSMVVSNMAPPENIFLITNGPSYVGVNLPLGSPCGRMMRFITRSPIWYAWCLTFLLNALIMRF